MHLPLREYLVSGGSGLRCPKGQFISYRVGPKIGGIGKARRLAMTNMIFAVIAALTGVFFGLQPAQANQAPWCAVIIIQRQRILGLPV